MQVRRFEKLIQTGYIVQNCQDYLAIGSSYVHNLLAVDAETFEIRKSPIVTDDKSHWAEIIERIEKLPRDVLKEIMTLDDEIENPLPVFTWRHHQIKETQTEDYEWPNTDHKGFILYMNTTFKTEKECAKYARKEIAFLLDAIERQLSKNIKEAQMVLDWVKEYRKDDKYLSGIEAKYMEANNVKD